MDMPFNHKGGNGGVLVGKKLPGRDAPAPGVVTAKVGADGFARKPAHPVDKTIKY